MGGNTVKTQKKECAMKNKSKITKGIAIGLFVVAFLLNVSLTFDSGNSQNADLSLGSLNVSLFQKAYAGEGGSGNDWKVTYHVGTDGAWVECESGGTKDCPIPGV